MSDIDIYEKTRSVVKSMLRENTGKHMLDSGGEDNRHWQRNRKRDFESEPSVFCRIFSEQDIEYEINIYHFLITSMQYDADTDQQFRAHLSETDEAHLGAMENFVRFERASAGPGYSNDPPTVNTTNFDNILSQPIQFVAWTENPGSPVYVLLQVHNGADIRGGYTVPRAFRLTCPTSELEDKWSSIRATCQFDHTWTSDQCGYTWREKGVCSKPLEEYDRMPVNKKPDDIREAIVLYDKETNTQYCPECTKENPDSLSGIHFEIDS